MALPLPYGKQIQIYKRVLSSEFTMNSMEAATDHYSIGFLVHGDRTIITPQGTYTTHPGDIHTIAPFLYHKTVPASSEYYENILIKFSEDFVKPFTNQLGKHVLDKIYSCPISKINNQESRNTLFSLAQDMLNVSESTGFSDEKIQNFELQTLLFQILVLIFENGTTSENTALYHSPVSPQILDAIYYIESDFMNSPRIEKAAQIAGYSVSYFSRLFQNQLGISFSEYCTDVRLKHTQHALLTSNKSITTIALEMGFTHPGNLTSCFKKKFSMTPLQYRKKNAVTHSPHMNCKTSL